MMQWKQKSNLQYLIPLSHAFSLGRAVRLDASDKDAHVVAPNKAETHTALLNKPHRVLV